MSATKMKFTRILRSYQFAPMALSYYYYQGFLSEIDTPEELTKQFNERNWFGPTMAFLVVNNPKGGYVCYTGQFLGSLETQISFIPLNNSLIIGASKDELAEVVVEG